MDKTSRGYRSKVDLMMMMTSLEYIIQLHRRLMWHIPSSKYNKLWSNGTVQKEQSKREKNLVGPIAYFVKGAYLVFSKNNFMHCTLSCDHIKPITISIIQFHLNYLMRAYEREKTDVAPTMNSSWLPFGR